MRTRTLLIRAKYLAILVICLALNAPAQLPILDAIKDAIKGKTKESTTDKKSDTPEKNTAADMNTAVKREFFTGDVFVKTYDEQKQAHTESCFSNRELAMQVNWKDARTGKNETAYTDSEGFFTAYNDKAGRFEKTKLLSIGGMDMIGPNAMLSAYQLPVGPYWEASEKWSKRGLKIGPFLLTGFAYIYKPQHFRDGAYTETKVDCRGNRGCTKFEINKTGYNDSFILFDDRNRLIDINVNVKNDPLFKSGSGTIEYFYDRGCNFSVPPAVEVKSPGQDLFILN